MSEAEATSSSGPALAEPAGGYRVLARKYRPQTFDAPDRPGRDGAHALECVRDRAAFRRPGFSPACAASARPRPRAFSRARSITNWPDGSVTGPTVKMPALGVHCQAIMESRHLDVIEMDAASHNGVDDVRQINDAIRYAPVSARYKVYILDEVHMLSPQAFNALLKTLEEPPPHAKFVFATTEIRKVPVTVLSRCQRFDLRRVEAGTLVNSSGQRRERRRHRDRARGARADRARGGRLGARFALAARSGDRARRRTGARRARPADARPRRPGAGDRSVRIA